MLQTCSFWGVFSGFPITLLRRAGGPFFTAVRDVFGLGLTGGFTRDASHASSPQFSFQSAAFSDGSCNDAFSPRRVGGTAFPFFTEASEEGSVQSLDQASAPQPSAMRAENTIRVKIPSAWSNDSQQILFPNNFFTSSSSDQQISWKLI